MEANRLREPRQKVPFAFCALAFAKCYRGFPLHDTCCGTLPVDDNFTILDKTEIHTQPRFLRLTN